MTIKRLPKFAERHFSLLCSNDGALCTHSEEDENGWDYLVEFEPEASSKPIDMRPGRQPAYVQIKSKPKLEPQCTITVSNALKFAKNKSPCFIILVVASTIKKPVRYFAIHFWKDLIERALEAGRKAERDGTKINKMTLTITFTNNDEKGDNVVSWMHDTIRRIPDYENTKAKMAEAAGFDGIFGTGHIDFGEQDPADIVDHFLGYKEDLKINKLSLSTVRFGIAIPEQDMGPGRVQITQASPRDCVIRIKNIKTSEELRFNGQILTPGIRVSEELFKLRVKSEFFDMVYKLDGKADWTIKVETGDKYPLRDIHKISTVFYWHATQRIDVQIWIDKQRLIGSVIETSADKLGMGQNAIDSWGSLSVWTELLRRIVGDDGESDCKLALSDFNSNYKEMIDFWKLHIFEEITIVDSKPTEYSHNVDCAIYYTYIYVGEYVFCSIIKRDVVKFDETGGVRKIVLGKPEMVESCYKDASDGRAIPQLEEDCNRYMKVHSGSDAINLGGQILDLVAERRSHGVPISGPQDD
ncbi:hypothetical protein FFK22_024775 [Mycobacterium sp. KBS0706]|uniref:hypothetical protein n=1 Tax=Mycobacterium sp. KBS0706 TaxID=2578109 RepID=UPI00110FD1A7|nr:hypothetical protein [Mycobacterium sp. KBS0706]TSD86035.1 hypothetical protein FFK22_024775 [Mycobacterium sp. KBS0706]